MKTLLMTLLISLVASVGFSQAEFNFRYFNEDLNVFVIEDWKVHQLIRESEERVLLIKELEQALVTLDRLETVNGDLQADTTLLKNIVLEKEYKIKDLNSELILTNNLYDKCLDLSSSSDKSIHSLEWALKKEKVRNKWLQWSTGITGGAIVVYLVVEMLKK